MADVTVTSWLELHERLFGETWQAPLERFRGTFAYRGMSRVGDLRTSLIRLDPQGRPESHLLRNFRKYAHRDAVPGDSIWNWLALAQHHYLPTRLLDWSFSPLVAMHFATQNLDQYACDGVIWRVDFARLHQLLPRALRDLLIEQDADVFTAEMLSRAAGTLEEFDHLASEPFAVFFEPPSLDDRIVNQFAMFSLMSSPTARLDEFLLKHPDTNTRLTIPPGLKWEIRDKLDQANITERVLFPGLDGLSRWLTRYYTSKPS